MLSKLEIAKGIKKVDDYYNCSSGVYTTCLVCPFNSNALISNNPSCIFDALQYLKQHEKKIYQWKNINAK